MASDEWEFDEGAVLRELYPAGAPGGVPKEPTEYRVKHRLADTDTEDRFYHVEKADGGTHLYSAGALEGRYEAVSVEESARFEPVEDSGGVDW